MKYCPLCGEEYADVETCPGDGAVLIHERQGLDQLIGQVVKGSYRIEEQIGVGGMGAVYRAVQIPLERDVAVKCLLPNLQSTPSMVQRFFQEAKLLSQLNHANVVSVIDFGNTETGMIYMVMEYLVGSTLGEVVPKDQGLPLARTVQLMRQACAGIGAAHRCNLVHRDLKPDNIFVSRDAAGDELVKVLDFGIARMLEGEQHTRLTQTGLLMGTPGFIAPEQIEATSEADARADVYALGAILYFMLTGRRPYHGATPHSILAQQLQEPPEVELGLLGESLTAVVLKGMHRDPEARYASAGELLAALEEATGEPAQTAVTARQIRVPDTSEADAPPLEPTRSLTQPAVATSSSRRRLLWLAAVLLVGLGGAAWLWTSQKEPEGVEGEVRGVTATRVTVGMSAPFSGASRELGRGMKLGLETSFAEVNENGGIHGRELELIALDDGYEPSRTAANMAELLFDRQVFAILGNVGTPTAEIALPLALEQQVPFLGAFTGADLLRKQPPDRYVFNYRASYAEETAAIVEYFLDVLGLAPAEIAVFAQEDSFGDAGYRGVVDTLEQRGYGESVPRLGYRRNTIAVNNAVQAILERHEEVRALVLVATYRAAAELIQRIEDGARDLTYASLSFVGSGAFAEELREMGPQYADGVIVTQVVPHFESSEAGVTRFRELLARHFPAEHPGFVSLEGYLVGRIFAETLQRAGEDLTVEGFIGAAESISAFDLGIGAPVSYGADQHQATSRVWGTVLDRTASYRMLPLDGHAGSNARRTRAERSVRSGPWTAPRARSTMVAT